MLCHHRLERNTNESYAGLKNNTALSEKKKRKRKEKRKKKVIKKYGFY